VCQLEEPVPAPVDDSLIKPCNVRFGFLPVVRTLHFAGQGALGSLQGVQGLAIVQGACNRLSVRCGEESLQAKIKACAVTRHDLSGLACGFLNHKVQIEIAQRVALNRHSLDVRWNLAAFEVLVHLALDGDLVAVQQLPARLLEGEAAVLLDFLEAWRPRAHLALVIAKEQLVRLVNALHDVLDRLGAYQVPMAILGQPLKLGEVLHQFVLVQAFARQLVVLAMQSNAVVVDQPRNVNLLVQILILFGLIQLKLVRFHAWLAQFLLIRWWQGGQQWRSCARLSQHRYAGAFSACFPKDETTHIALSYPYCMLMHAIWQSEEHSFAKNVQRTSAAGYPSPCLMSINKIIR